MVAIVIQGDTQGERIPLWYALIFPYRTKKENVRNSKAYNYYIVVLSYSMGQKYYNGFTSHVPNL